MSKHAILTEEEAARYQPGAATVWYLDDYRHRHQLAKKEMNVLDWGCGRGRSVAYFREQGYNVFGVDVDPSVIVKGRPYFSERGFDADQLLTVLNEQGRTAFPDDFFHATFSEAVFEHVKGLESVAAELCRITRPGGIGIHSFPAHHHFIEAHLHMPFVHWLPKNHWRRQLISKFVHLRLEPSWPELQAGSIQEKIEGYYHYSINKTYYRSPGEIKRIMRQNGFEPQLVSVDHPKLKQHVVMRQLARLKTTRNVLNWIFSNFFLMVLLITKR